MAPDRRSPPDDLVEESFRDLAADFGQLASIALSTYARITRARAEVARALPHLRPATRRTLEEDLRSTALRYRSRLNDLAGLAELARTGPRSEGLLRFLARARQSQADLSRTTVGRAAALITATDWQSPSFLHAVHSMAGRHTGRITEHVDDYKRDRHPDAREFEEAYLREYVDLAPGWAVDALMANCGMAAFTTILAWLVMDRAPSRVLAGRSIYHECRDLVARSALGPRTCWVDETRTEDVLRAIDRERPEAMFLDSLANAKGLAVPDLGRILAHLARARRPVAFVVDNTGLSCTGQPFAMASPSPGLDLVVFESLTKYAQFGMDRTTAGMIVAPGPVAERLSAYREHLGANVNDTSVHVVPWPDRAALERRLARIQRNATLLAGHLQRVVEREGRGVFAGVTYPGLPHHPSYPVARELAFRGGFLSVDPAPGHDHPSVLGRFVRTVLGEAAARRVPLTAGASFGLDTTRVYLTATTSALGVPFVRVSPGIEHRLEVEALKEVLAAAVRRTARRSGGHVLDGHPARGGPSHRGRPATQIRSPHPAP